MTGASQENDAEDLVDPDDYDETVTCECPECGLTGDVPASWTGLQIECKDCGERFTVAETGGEGA